MKVHVFSVSGIVLLGDAEKHTVSIFSFKTEEVKVDGFCWSSTALIQAQSSGTSGTFLPTVLNLKNTFIIHSTSWAGTLGRSTGQEHWAGTLGRNTPRMRRQFCSIKYTKANGL